MEMDRFIDYLLTKDITCFSQSTATEIVRGQLQHQPTNAGTIININFKNFPNFLVFFQYFFEKLHLSIS